MKRGGPRYYVLDGRTPVPADLLTWARSLDQEDATRRIALDRIGESEVSTVFLGLDHSFGEGPPVLFETLVFGGPLSGECDRYETYDEAEAGHRAMVLRVKKRAVH